MTKIKTKAHKTHRVHDQSRGHLGVISMQDFDEYTSIPKYVIHYPYDAGSAWLHLCWIT